VRKSTLLVMAVSLAGVVALAHADQVTFENELSECATVAVDKVSAASNVVLAKATITVLKPIGDCRCLSALATYSSSVNRGGVRQVLQEGLVGLKSSGAKVFVLASEPALVAGKKVTVNLGCAGPL
jgi:hypothetical protein